MAEEVASRRRRLRADEPQARPADLDGGVGSLDVLLAPFGGTPRANLVNTTPRMNDTHATYLRSLEAVTGEVDARVAMKRRDRARRGRRRLRHDGRAGQIAEELVELERIVDARALVDKAAARFRVAHATRPLDVEIGGPLPAISGDPVLLRRVVDNLLDNAHTYTQAPGAKIVPSASAAGGAVAIEVRDAGVGIAPDDRARVFEPFSRVRAD